MTVIPFEGKTDLFGAQRCALNNYLNPSSGGILWSILKPDAPCRITPNLLTQFLSVQQELLTATADRTKKTSVSFHVLGSDIPDIFSLGGDLRYFYQCARRHDRAALQSYARDSVEFVYQLASNYHLPVTTITLIRGMALGGGFEAALAANIMIAEEQAVFAFPETRFGLFPGMGAYTFLRQRVPSHIAEEIIYSGREYSAHELHEMNIVDRVCPQGQGYKTTLQFISRRQQQQQGIQSMRKMVQQFSPVNRQELDTIVNFWVDSVLNLDNKHLRLIEAISNTTYQPGSLSGNRGRGENHRSVIK